MMENRGGGLLLPGQRPPNSLEQLAVTVNALIDFNLALVAMCMEKGVFTSEQLFKMEDIIKDARRRLGPKFTTKQGIEIVRAAFRIEVRGKEKK